MSRVVLVANHGEDVVEYARSLISPSLSMLRVLRIQPSSSSCDELNTLENIDTLVIRNVAQAAVQPIIATACAALVQGGTLLVEHSQAWVHTLGITMILGGLMDVRCSEESGMYVIAAHKPSWDKGAAAKLPDHSQTPLPTTAWKMSANALAEEDLIDEDELLNTDGILASAVRGCGVDDTSQSQRKRRACANCSCGLAELEAEENNESKTVTKEQLANKVSACGACAKGDAFRCASCPFLGKPAFQPGQERVMLSLVGTDDI